MEAEIQVITLRSEAETERTRKERSIFCCFSFKLNGKESSVI